MNDFLTILAIGVSATLFFGMILGFNAFKRWMRHREVMELARQGLLHPHHQIRDNRRSSRLRRIGVMITAIGLAITVGLGTLGFGPWLIGGFIPLALGASMVWMSDDNERREENSAESSPVYDNEDPIPPHKKQ